MNGVSTFNYTDKKASIIQDLFVFIYWAYNTQRSKIHYLWTGHITVPLQDNTFIAIAYTNITTTTPSSRNSLVSGMPAKPVITIPIGGVTTHTINSLITQVTVLASIIKINDTVSSITTALTTLLHRSIILYPPENAVGM